MMSKIETEHLKTFLAKIDRRLIANGDRVVVPPGTGYYAPPERMVMECHGTDGMDAAEVARFVPLAIDALRILMGVP